MDLSPPLAQFGKPPDELRCGGLELAPPESVIVDQAHSPRIAVQLETRFRGRAHDMHVRRPVIVRVDPDRPTLQQSANRRHDAMGSIITEAMLG
jgi:hypothetical protein